MQRSTPCSSPLPQCSQSTLPLLLHVSFQFLIHYSFFCMVGVILSRGLCWFTPDVAVGILHDTYLLTLWSLSPKQVWCQCLVGALLFSQCNVAYRSFVRSGGAGCQSFDSSWCFFFLPSVAPASQENFLFIELTLSASAL
jgi:hypothetical protein